MELARTQYLGMLKYTEKDLKLVVFSTMSFLLNRYQIKALAAIHDINLIPVLYNKYHCQYQRDGYCFHLV